MRKVVILPIAEQDLAGIVEYLAQFYESTALRQYDHIVNKIKDLTLFPEKYEIYSEGQYRLPYRRMPVDSYLVFYVVLEDTIEIHRILHGSREIKCHLNDADR
ncbi:MAG: type II toxin-antitoxin system RelE/ParE family toxin [Dethiobacter sp.]|jgi:plasmid stabilization system protein ParE|nr:type II toxin-antitoxin system RelE/ParE family toxin [Dethiobacter sp.]MBS3982845.1 type II toxin-antitoxin system RelE/ParE family toxin [Dethiobacter sp.]MCL4463228.1 type II toxin-antitoxin system RelE/ParE family toxin [Bacillota bacterium]MCL5993129.1 type II toxin-antitoxin system RelE/ParE family toxin [Bacillota bacterium]